ncbi:protein kinase [Actinomadura sp. J1-007]|nr:protein kinase [Actinomadura sp. J1-007]
MHPVPSGRRASRVLRLLRVRADLDGRAGRRGDRGDGGDRAVGRATRAGRDGAAAAGAAHAVRSAGDDERHARPVPRSRVGRHARAAGDWPPPKLKRGELVGGQYHVRGCLRRGGLGWIYLAHDNNVGHWVVLKGLLHDGADVSDLPEAERAALAAVNHPNIVKIHNFVRHPAPAPGAGPEEARETQSYIVMEYVGGRSLKELLDDRRRAEGPDAALPIDHVIAYGIEMLRALGYLHTQGLLYCDLKPDNVMQCEQRLTLIDLGGTWRMGGPASAAPIWGTPGFGAPEVGWRRRRSAPTSTRWAARWPSSASGSTSPATTPRACRRARTCRCCPGSTPTTGCCGARPTPTRASGSGTRRRWPSSSSASCARSCPCRATPSRGRCRPRCSDGSGARSAPRSPRPTARARCSARRTRPRP